MINNLKAMTNKTKKRALKKLIKRNPNFRSFTFLGETRLNCIYVNIPFSSIFAVGVAKTKKKNQHIKFSKKVKQKWMNSSIYAI